jgi:hypothetical protein
MRKHWEKTGEIQEENGNLKAQLRNVTWLSNDNGTKLRQAEQQIATLTAALSAYTQQTKPRTEE